MSFVHFTHIAGDATSITYLTGDATEPVGNGYKIIVHCCNDQGKWGKGFVLALSRKWAAPERDYRDHFWPVKNEATGTALGDVRLVQVADDISVANLIGQHGIGPDSNGNPPIRYRAIDKGFRILKCRIAALEKNHPNLKPFSVHMPRLGCGLAGGEWDKIEQLIKLHFLENKIPVFVYDLPS